MITVHNLQNSVAKPVKSSIIFDPDKDKVEPTGSDGWQAFSGKSTITGISPTAVSEPNTNGAANLADTQFDLYNRAKAIDIAVGIGADDIARVVAKTGKTYLLQASQFGNWRKKSVNGFTDISNRVMLMSDGNTAPVFSGNIKYETESLGNTVLKTGIGKTVSSLAQTVNDLATVGAAAGLNINTANIDMGERMSLYQDFPAWKVQGTTSTSSVSNLKFKFRFGQASIFSGEEEVVKPILALLMPFALKSNKSAHSIVGAFPNVKETKQRAMLNTIGLIKNKGIGEYLNNSIGKDDTGILNKVLNSVNNVTEGFFRLIDDIAESLFSMVTTITVICGGIVSGPYICKEVKWSFDFTDVDEYGYPCSGTIEFNSLSNLRILLGSDFPRQWGYSSEYDSNMTSLEKENLIKAGLEASDTMKATADGPASSNG